ncbi:MAG: sigma 54-interacting transcriptional regulator [Syntrophobacter sp.]
MLVEKESCEGLYLTDYSSGKLCEINRWACENLGYSREEFLRMPISHVDIEVTTRDHRKRFWDGLGPGQHVTFEGAHRRKNGSIFRVEVFLIRMDIDSDRFILGFTHDISEQKKSRERPRESFSNIEALKKQLETENLLRRENMKLRHGNEEIVGNSDKMIAVFNAAAQVAGTNSTVLILGETGTGKELIADAVQQVSERRDGPFIKVNCGAIPESLMDSELFGFEKGAFTGASSARAGFFEQASGGTLFLDEVGELSLQAQARLLRVLQNGVVQRLGSANPTSVDVRIIAATNRNLESMVQCGKFREDLYYRLNVFPIRIPPLRERCEDIPLLVGHFVASISARWGTPARPLDVASLDRLMAYSWPGNVRELENLVERALILEPLDPLNFAKYLPQGPAPYLHSEEGNDYLRNLIDDRLKVVLDGYFGTRSKTEELNPNKAWGEKNLARGALPSLDTIMIEYINKALIMSKGKINGPGGAAEILQVHPNTLRKRMVKLGVGRPHLSGTPQ